MIYILYVKIFVMTGSTGDVGNHEVQPVLVYLNHWPIHPQAAMGVRLSPLRNLEFHKELPLNFLRPY